MKSCIRLIQKQEKNGYLNCLKSLYELNFKKLLERQSNTIMSNYTVYISSVSY